jgi:hypothetical protein
MTTWLRGPLVCGALVCALAGCWGSDGIGGDGDGDGGDTEELPTDGTDTFEEVDCADLSPCVESEIYGYTCPGAVIGVICWDLGAHCNATFLCANTTQACALACGAGSCTGSSGTPPHPQCD